MFEKLNAHFGAATRAEVLKVCAESLEHRSAQQSARIAQGHISSDSLDPIDHLEAGDFHNLIEKFATLLLPADGSINPKDRKELASFLRIVDAIQAMRNPAAHGEPLEYLDAAAALKNVRWVLLRLGLNGDARRIEKMADELEAPPRSTRAPALAGTPTQARTRAPRLREDAVAALSDPRPGVLGRSAWGWGAAFGLVAIGAAVGVLAVKRSGAEKEIAPESAPSGVASVASQRPAIDPPIAQATHDHQKPLRAEQDGGEPSTRCDAPCCGGIRCNADADTTNLMPDRCPATGTACRPCPSGRACVPMHCAAPLPSKARWRARVGRVVDTETGKDLFESNPTAVVCLRPFSSSPTARFVCSSLADSRTPSMHGKCRLPVTVGELQRTGLEIVVIDSDQRAKNFLAWMNPVHALDMPAGRSLCEGYEFPPMQGKYSGSRKLAVTIHLDDPVDGAEHLAAGCEAPHHATMEAWLRRR